MQDEPGTCEIPWGRAVELVHTLGPWGLVPENGWLGQGWRENGQESGHGTGEGCPQVPLPSPQVPSSALPCLPPFLTDLPMSPSPILTTFHSIYSCPVASPTTWLPLPHSGLRGRCLSSKSAAYSCPPDPRGFCPRGGAEPRSPSSQSHPCFNSSVFRVGIAPRHAGFQRPYPCLSLNSSPPHATPLPELG